MSMLRRAKSGGLTKVQGNTLVVAAPQNQESSDTPPPAKVKRKWTSRNRERLVGRGRLQTRRLNMKEKIKTQDLKKIPAAECCGNAAAATGANASVAPGGSPAVATSPFEKRKG